MQVEGQHKEQSEVATGARVSNRYAICRQLGHNPSKDGLIPHDTGERHLFLVKDLLVDDKHAYH